VQAEQLFGSELLKNLGALLVDQVVDSFLILSKHDQVVFALLVFRVGRLTHDLRALHLGEEFFEVVVLLFGLLLQLLLGHVEFAEDRGGIAVAVVGAIVGDGDIDGQEVAGAGDDVIERVLGQEAMSFVHLVFEKSVEAIFTSTCVVSELRIGVLFQLGANFFLIESQVRELILNFLERLCVPQLHNSFVFGLANKHQHNRADEPSNDTHLDEVVLVKEIEVPFMLAPFLLCFFRLILILLRTIELVSIAAALTFVLPRQARQD
jgi:hypothetical protein